MTSPHPSFDHPIRSRIVKEELCSRVELLETDDGVAVRKTYRNRPFLLWRSFLTSSRAAREFRNLGAMWRAGVACVRPIAWEEVRKLGCVPQSILVTEFLADAPSLKSLLPGPEGRERTAWRREVARKLGTLARTLHLGGFLSSKLVPRNVLVHGQTGALSLCLCDQPATVHFHRSIHRSRVARVDLFDLAFSKQRQRDFMSTERWRLVISYCDGDLAAARRIWRVLTGRRLWVNRVWKAAVVGLDNYVFAALRALSRGRFHPRREPETKTAPLRNSRSA